MVKITVKNKNEIIQLSGPPYFIIEKLDGGKWIQIKEYVGCPCALPKCIMEPVGPIMMEPKSDETFNLTLKIRTGCKGFETLWWEASSGKYRISVDISTNCTNLTYPYRCDESIKIFSNEFTIK